MDSIITTEELEELFQVTFGDLSQPDDTTADKVLLNAVKEQIHKLADNACAELEALFEKQPVVYH